MVEEDVTVEAFVDTGGELSVDSGLASHAAINSNQLTTITVLNSPHRAEAMVCNLAERSHRQASMPGSVGPVDCITTR